MVGEISLRTFDSTNSRKFGSLDLEIILVYFGRWADFRPGRFLPRKLARIGQISCLAHLLLNALENLPK